MDLGLELIQVFARGERLSYREIAAWCGCDPSYIFRLEKRALAKLRKALVNEKRGPS